MCECTNNVIAIVGKYNFGLRNDNVSATYVQAHFKCTDISVGFLNIYRDTHIHKLGYKNKQNKKTYLIIQLFLSK